MSTTIKWPDFYLFRKIETRKLRVELNCHFQLNASLSCCCVLHSPPRAEGSTGEASGTNNAASSPAAGSSTDSPSQEKDSPSCK